MRKSKIIGTGSSFPFHSMDNNFLSDIVNTSDAWIKERTGICSRRIASSETAVSMGAAAAIDALHMAGLSARDLDLILIATFTPDYIMPKTGGLPYSVRLRRRTDLEQRIAYMVIQTYLSFRKL